MILFLAIAGIIAGLWIYARWNYGSLEKMGIPVVPYKNPILGSVRELYENVGGLQDIQWWKKFGTVFGLYEGRQATIYLCDPDLARLVLMKDGPEHFQRKRDFDFGDPITNELPDFQPYDKWKVIRSMVSPVFSSAKVKMMNLPMRQATVDFIKELKGQIKDGNGLLSKLPIDQALHTMLTDLVGRALFSIQIDNLNDRNNEFSKIVKEAMLPPENISWFTQQYSLYSHAFPFIKKLQLPLEGLAFVRSEPTKRFGKILHQMMKERRLSGQKYNDIVDMAIEWDDKLNTEEYKRLKITELSLLCQIMLFYSVTQEVVGGLMAIVIYHIVKDPELEKKIYAEVDAAFEKHGNVDHEHLTQLHTLQSCITECIRLHTTFHRTERVCTKDWRNEEYNLNIKKGTIVVIPIWVVNRSEKNFENPEEFDYTRFLPENKEKNNANGIVSFGMSGHMACTGKRFSTESMTLVLAYLVRHLKFKKRADTELNFVPGGFFMTAHEPIFVDVEARELKTNS